MRNIDIALFKTFGDLLIGTAIVHAIKKKYPDSYIRFYTEPGYQEILEGNPEINEIIPAYTYNDVYSHIYKHNLKSDHIARLGMANHFDTCWHHNPETLNFNMFEYYMHRANLGLSMTPQDMVVRVFSDLENPQHKVPEMLPPKFICCHTTSLLETKNYPVQYFNHLAQMLTSKYHLPIIQVGGPTDAPIRNTTSFLGKLNVKQTKYVIDNCTFYVGIDSGCAYLAGASGKPTVLLMGSTSGKQVGPVGDNVFYLEPNRPNDPHCRPFGCVSHCALPQACIQLLTPESVMARIEQIIKL